MADTTTNESPTEIVPTVLGEYLLKEVSSLREFFPEFPSPNATLRKPCITIFAATNPFEPIVPYPKSPVQPGDIVNSKAPVLWVVGRYDVGLQLDLWTRNKEERDDMFDQLFNALNPNISPMGLVLPMEDYYGQLCEYVYNGHEINDSEERAQRDEWRMTLNILANFRAIRAKKEYVIEQTQTAAEIELAGEISSDVKV